MAEVDPSKLNADSHLLLDQPLLRLPLELQRRNFKKSQQYIDHEQKQVLNLLKDATKKATSQPSDQTLQDIDNMIKRMEGLKRKLELLNAEEDTILDHSSKRIRHLQELYEIPNLTDVKYEKWSRTRLDRLVVDYLLRSGFTDTATALAQARNISDLIDLDAFISCHKIADSIAAGQTTEALAWVKDNRDGLKKLLEKEPVATINKSSINGNALITSPKITSLEFELRFQEYLELLRPGSQNPNSQFDALIHAQKYLKPHEPHFALRISTAVGLLAQDPRNPEGPYADSFSPSRWTFLRNLFIETHHQMLNLPIRPLIHVALSAGLSALKTPACHSRFNPASAATDDHPKLASSQTLPSTATPTDPSDSKGGSTATMSLGGLCPICSTELNDLARPVPYAHHTTSHVENDAVVLPNGRVYGRYRLEELQRKLLRVQGLIGAGLAGSGDDGEELIGRADMEVRDPVTGEEFLWQDVRRVYIS